MKARSERLTICNAGSVTIAPGEIQLQQAAPASASPAAFNNDSRLTRKSMAFGSTRSSLKLSASALRICAVAAIAVLLPTSSAFAQAIALTRTTASPVSSSLLPAVSLAKDNGRLPASTPMRHMALHFALSDAQQSELKSLIHAQQDPTSAQYHKWLTPAEFQQRFGRSTADVAAAETWLRSEGFTIETSGPESISFSGTVSQVESAFHTQMHNYTLGKKKFQANATAIALPANISEMVRGVSHLNTLRPTPLHITKKAVKLDTNFTSSSDGSHYTVPSDVQTIYDINPIYTAGYTGAGQTIVVVGQSQVDPNDIALFHANFGGSENLIMTLVPFTGDSAITSSDDEGESDLDIEYSGSIAANATVNFVYTGNGGTSDAFDAMQYAIQNNLAPVISISYGTCELLNGQIDSAIYGFFMDQASTQGETLIVASGDDGATACDAGSTQSFQGLAVQFPADSPDVTGIGGTEFNEGSGTYWSSTNNAQGGSALSYIPEMVWNDDATSSELAASGGGASTIFSKPDWQIGTGVPADEARDIPDVALDASNEHDSYFYCGAADENGNNCADGYVYVAGGTSFGAPIFAGMTALINEATASTGQGNINPTLYPLAASNPSVFHDIILGNNDSPCIPGSTDCGTGVTEIGYNATPGYDQTTGLGTVDSLLLAKSFPNYGTGTALAGSVTTMTYTPAAPTAGDTINFNATVASASGSAASGNLQFLVDGTPTGAPVALSGGTASFSNPPLTSGGHIVVAQYLGNSTLGGSAFSALVNVAALPATSTVVSISPATPTTANAINISMLVSSATPGTPTGTIDVQVDGNDTNNPPTLAKGQATATIPSLSAGSHTITATYSGDTSYSSSSGVATFNVLALSGSTVNVSVTPTAPSSTDSVTATAVVTTGATGSVQFLLDATAVGTPVAVANGTAQYSLGTLAAGSHTVTAQYTGDSQFAAGTGQQVFVVSSTAAAFSLKATNVTVAANGSASSTVTVASTSDYAGTVELAVSGSGPANACFLVNSNPSVTAQGTATAQISIYAGSDCATVQNSARVKTFTSSARTSGGNGLPSASGISLSLVGGAGLFLLARRRRSITHWLVVLFAISVLGFVSGCGGSSSASTTTTTSTGATAGTYTLTVTGTDATSASNTATTTFTLTVQ